MRKEDLIYTAALVDGEGSVLLQHSGGNENRSPALTVPSTTFAFMRFLKTTFGGHVSTKVSYKKTHNKSWSWSVRRDKALFVLHKILPYMKEPEKIRRAKLLTRRYKAVTVRNGRYTVKQIRAREKFESEFFYNSLKVRT